MKKLSQIAHADELKDIDYVIVVRDNGDGTFSDLLVKPLAALKKRLVVSATGPTISDAFIDKNTITEIVMNNQVYLSDIDFSQAGGVITGITISFTTSDTIILKL